MAQADEAEKEASQKRAVAYHEAGHATAARHGGGEFDSVRIEKGVKDWKGQTNAVYFKKDIVAKARYFAAGNIAQERGAPGSSSGTLQDQADINNLNRLAYDNIGDPAKIGPYASAEDQIARDQFTSTAVREATEILGKHWDEVEKIASALLERGALSAAEVDELLK